MQFLEHLRSQVKVTVKTKEGTMRSIRRHSGALRVMMILLFWLLLLTGTAIAAANQEPTVLIPWEEKGAKQPADYTFEEFDQLSQAQKDAFMAAFPSTEDFNRWADAAQSVTLPWKSDGAKQPKDYTFEEFDALSQAQKNAFMEEFQSTEEFNEWADEAQAVELPWKQPGAKQPKDYTYEEFSRLSDNQKLQFIAEFESREAFDKWMDALQSGEGDQADPETETAEGSANRLRLVGAAILGIVLLAGIVFGVKMSSAKRKKQ